MPSPAPSNREPSADLVRFGRFEADLRSGELRKNGVKVKIQELPFRALKLLVSNPDEVLSRDEFRQALWPDGVFVDFDRGISSAINRLRDALGDSAENPVFVETVGRRGYRWIAPTHSPEPAGPAATPQPANATEAPRPTAPGPRWKWILILPVLALLFSAWIFRPGYRSARAGLRSPASSIADANFSYRPANHEAEDFYLKGRFYWNERTPESLNQAVDAFTQAIVHDPKYAQAYVGLADCYNLLREYTVMPASEAYPRALAAARKAVELDDQSSQAHASLAFALFYGALDSAAADREFRRSLELNPNNAIAHHWYATCLHALGRSGEAVAEIDRAQALDPSSKSILADKGPLLIGMGRQREALTLLLQMEASEPAFMSPHRYLKYLYLDTHDYPNYLAEMRKEAVITHDRSAQAVAEAAGKAFATGDARSMLEAVRREQTKLYDQGQFSPYRLAETYAALGNQKGAVAYLQIAYDRRADGIMETASNPLFRGLHDDPAFLALLAKMGMSPVN
ncbi:MAG TPA: tetratricopeptide repeat protein [Candidatus Sulfotelmatobacter sp.]|nr:tetratricopeptide repeat protein [Candidatus Sulfotelmatobacter sp.]